jgi:hypothetical protein
MKSPVSAISCPKSASAPKEWMSFCVFGSMLGNYNTNEVSQLTGILDQNESGNSLECAGQAALWPAGT